MKKYLFGTTMLALAALAGMAHADDTKQTINICTGSASKPYNATGNLIGQYLQDSKDIDFKVITTQGSWDNVQRGTGAMTPERIASGDACQVFIAQPDAMVRLSNVNQGAAEHARAIGHGPVEYLHVLCSKKSGITDLKQLKSNPKATLAVGKDGSGAWLIWNNFISANKDYANVPTLPNDGLDAVTAVDTNTASCALIPTGIKSGIMNQVNDQYSDTIGLVTAGDNAFAKAKNADGEALYTWSAIPSGTYPKLQTGFFSSKVETIAWAANIYVNTDLIKDETRYNEILQAVSKSRAGIKRAYGSLD